MRLATFFLRAFARPVSEPSRKYRHRRYPVPASVTLGLRRLCEAREDRVLNEPVFTLRPKRNGSSWYLIYTHGGAYADGLLKAHWWIVAALIRATGATVTVPTYPLTPEHQHMEAYRELEQVYRRVLQKAAPGRIILCGDSAGGGLALGQALFYKDRGLPLPGRIVLSAPWLDVTLSNPEAKALEPTMVNMPRIEPLREIGRWWAGSADPRTPVLSPLFGDLHGLPPIDVYIGTRDILLPDLRRLRDRVSAAGGEIHLHETDGGFRVFMGATFTPEAKWVYTQIARDLGLAAMARRGRSAI